MVQNVYMCEECTLDPIEVKAVVDELLEQSAKTERSRHLKWP